MAWRQKSIFFSSFFLFQSVVHSLVNFWYAAFVLPKEVIRAVESKCSGALPWKCSSDSGPGSARVTWTELLWCVWAIRSSVQSRFLGIKLLGRPDGTSLRRGSWKNACSVGCSSELHWGDVIEACTGNCPLCLDTKLSIRAPYFAWKKEKKIECFELNNFHQVVIYEDVTLWFLQVINTIQGIIVGGRWERHRACPSWFILIFIVVSRSHSQRAVKSRSFWGWCNFVFCLLASNFWVFQKSKRWPFSSLSSIQCPGAGTHHHLAQFYEAAQRMHFPMPTVSWDAWGQI